MALIVAGRLITGTELLGSRTALKRCTAIVTVLLFFDPGTQRMKKLRYAIQKKQKSSWNEPYSSSSFTKQSCSKTALYR